MKKLILLITFFVLIITSIQTNAYHSSEYYITSVKAVIDSPNLKDLWKIKNKVIKHCEQVYLEASRRREYTELELKYCSDVFEIKRQQELDYMTYMLKNRGIY